MGVLVMMILMKMMVTVACGPEANVCLYPTNIVPRLHRLRWRTPKHLNALSSRGHQHTWIDWLTACLIEHWIG